MPSRSQRHTHGRRSDAYIAGNIKAQGLELIFQPILGDAMKFVQRKFGSLAAQSETAPVHFEHSIVQIPLGIRELAIDRPCSSNVRNIASPFL